MASKSDRKIIVSTCKLYDSWANIYDNDDNILQLIDDAAFDEIIKPLLYPANGFSTKKICCELGCGTGRNTNKLLNAGWFVVAIDLSSNMMSKAQQRIKQTKKEYQSSISWVLYDLNSNNELLIRDSLFDACVSTLVIEHIQSIEQFFQTIYRILKKTNDSWAFITAMHPNMYKAGSQASFVIDKSTSEKLCGISFDHSTESIIEAARKANLKLIKLCEKSVENADHAKQLGLRAKKWISVNIHISFLFKIEND